MQLFLKRCCKFKKNSVTFVSGNKNKTPAIMRKMMHQKNGNERVSTSLFVTMRETEKAVAFQATGDKYGKRKEMMIWIPKSMIVDGTVPAWKIQRGLAEAASYNMIDGMVDMVSNRTGNALDVDELMEIGLV